ncbi:MAG: helix-turn-helix domain-containing protein [archaeon]
MDTSILEDLGLTQAEIKTYIALLELGTSSAGRILEKSRLQNSVVHRALNSLIEKGLISYILEGRRKIYQATNPDNFMDFIDDKKRRFKEILPELRNIRLFSEKETRAELLRGKRGINELYVSLLDSGGEEYNTFGGGSRVTHEVMSDSWWRNLHAKRIDRGIPSRQVFDETLRPFGKRLNRLRLTQIRFLPREFEQLQETITIGDCVGIAIFTENPYGVLIRDRTVAEGYRKQFEILWETAFD